MTSQQLMKTSHLQVSICCKCLDEMPGLCSWGPEEGLLPTPLELPRKGRGRSMWRASLWENGCVTGERDLAITVALGIQNSVTILFEPCSVAASGRFRAQEPEVGVEAA